MKKALLALGGVVLTGGILGMSFLGGDTDPKDTTNTGEGEESVEAVKNEQAEKTTLPVPTSRTVDIGSNKPWEYMDAQAIIEQQNKGEVIYLFADAEAIENSISGFSTSEPVEGAPITKEDSAKSWANYLQGFIQGTEKYYPDKKDYFLKLSEIKVDLENGNFSEIPQKIEQAKLLRN